MLRKLVANHYLSGSVSYTHLDVYKRQGRSSDDFSFVADNENFTLLAVDQPCVHVLETVSYTHLDT